MMRLQILGDGRDPFVVAPSRISRGGRLRLFTTERAEFRSQRTGQPFDVLHTNGEAIDRSTVQVIAPVSMQ